VRNAFSQYMDCLEVLSLRQKEQEQKSAKQEGLWKLRVEELEEKLSRVTSRFVFCYFSLEARQLVPCDQA
jgi:hypothetical protein